MQGDDLICLYLNLERTRRLPTGLEYNALHRIFFLRFSAGVKWAVNVTNDEPADVMRAIAQLNEYLAFRDLPGMDVCAAGVTTDPPQLAPADKSIHLYSGA